MQDDSNPVRGLPRTVSGLPRDSGMRILIIEDEQKLAEILLRSLRGEGFTVDVANTAEDGFHFAVDDHYDLVILDLLLPDGSGTEVLRRLRTQHHKVPVLVLTARGDLESKVENFEAGADDYLTKPFGDGELLARLRALLRRIKPAVAANTFRFGDVEVDFAHRRVTKAGRPVKFTAMEYALLQLFIAHRDKVLTHRQILRELWGPKAELQTHYLRTYLLRLRRKLEDDLDAPRFFETEPGIGYRFVSEPAAAAV